ncbi:hypothetical protein M1D89_20190 [Arthrobacter sp. D3-18]
MTRLRIYVGVLSLLIGAPLFIYCISDPSIGAGAFIGTAVITAAGFALLYPARWTE